MNFKKSKYKNIKASYDGVKFDSLLEKNRYIVLKNLQKQGLIHSLELQPVFLLQDSFKVLKNNKKTTIRKLTYIADFSYIENNKFIVEDSKGFETDIYKLKRKMFLENCTFDIFKEVFKGKTNTYTKT